MSLYNVEPSRFSHTCDVEFGASIIELEADLRRDRRIVHLSSRDARAALCSPVCVRVHVRYRCLDIAVQAGAWKIALSRVAH